MGASTNVWIALAPFSEILLLGVVGLMLLVALSMRRTVVRTCRCPITGHQETVHFREAVEADRFVDVQRCSAFGPGQAITCQKACLSTTGPTRVIPLC